MNPTQRIMATIAGQAVDRRAVVPILSLYAARLTGCSLQEHYTNSQAFARGQSAVRETFNPDVLCTPFAFANLGAAFGSKVRYYTDQAPNVQQPVIESITQWDSLVFPDLDTHPQITFLRQSIRLMAREHKGEIPVAAILPLPSDFPCLIMGIENWISAVLFEPAAAIRAMDQMIPFFVDLTNRLFEDGANFAALPGAMACTSVAPRSLVSSFTRPTLDRSFVQVHGPIVFHHAGSPIQSNLDLVTHLPSTIAYVIDPNDDQVESRRIIGPEPVLFAGPMGPRIPTMTPDQVKQYCKEFLEKSRHDPRFILASTGADIPWQTSHEHIHALRQAAEEFGGFNP